MVALSKTKLYMKRIQSKDSVWLEKAKAYTEVNILP